MKSSAIKRLPSAAFVLLVLMASAAYLPRVGTCAQKPGDAEGGNVLKSDAPLHIASDRMEADQRERTVTFEGHVIVRQEDLTITGKRLKVYALKEDKPSKGAMMERIDRIEVEGDVKISQRDRIATAEKAVYYHGEQKIVLIGRPSVSQGQDTIRGRMITLYLEEERSVVEGGEETPVQAVFHPERGE